MSAINVQNWHPGCSVVCVSDGNGIVLWCPKHRVLAHAKEVGLAISSADSFNEDPKAEIKVIAQPTKGIPGFELFKGGK